MQKPLDLKRSLFDIVPSHVYFALYGEAAADKDQLVALDVGIVELIHRP